jgi:hypothetical protein
VKVTALLIRLRQLELRFLLWTGALCVFQGLTRLGRVAGRTVGGLRIVPNQLGATSVR